MPVFDLDVPHVERADITVDGVADEAAWAGAVVLPPFLAFKPAWDKPPVGPTTVRVLADERALYFDFVAEDPEPGKVRAGLGRRDSRIDADDIVGVYVDPAGKVQRSYLFSSNLLGVQGDGTNAAGAPEDLSWDARWQSMGRRIPTGYEVEIAIPWATIRHPRVSEQIGLWVFRKVPRLGETSSWPRLDPDVAGLLIQEAIVGGPGELHKTLGLELQPELTFGWTQDGPPDDRLNVDGVAPGLTARYSPSDALQVLGTINPDFSQVESDASQIDLNRRYALYYEEKRPFFLEGQETFTHPFDDLIYTRSMTTPVYGLRATSELGGWTTAALHVLDQQPQATVSEGGGWTDADLADRFAMDTVVRIRRAIGPDSFAGLLLSDKEILETGLGNRLVGLDSRVRLSDRWSIEGSALASSTIAKGVGSEAAPAGNLFLSYGSKHVSSWTTFQAISPDFRAENGYVTGADRIHGGTGLELDVFPHSKLVPAIALVPFDGALTVDHVGALRGYDLDPNVAVQFRNGLTLYGELDHDGDVYYDVLLPTDRATLDLEGAFTSWFRGDFGAETGTGALYLPEAPSVGWQDDGWAEVTFQPVPALATTFTGTFERFLLDGDLRYDGWVGRAKLEAFASRRVWMRLIADRTTFDRRTSTEALVAYEYGPGSAFYLGGSRHWTTPRSAGDEDPGWQVFAKGSWVFSL
jgi:hypothetical protein